jgi:RimJ/RimL family protein N-acetyltransferase
MTLRPTSPTLADEEIRLVPLAAAHEPDVAALVQDEDVRIYTRVPTHPPVDFATSWLGTYEQGWRDGSRAGFAVETRDGGFLGLGSSSASRPKRARVRSGTSSPPQPAAGEWPRGRCGS